MGPHKTEKLLSKGLHYSDREADYRIREDFFLSTHPSERGLISEIYKQLKKLDVKKTNDLIRMWSIDEKGEFSREETQVAEKTSIAEDNTDIIKRLS